jgi:hypothetical protein
MTSVFFFMKMRAKVDININTRCTVPNGVRKQVTKSKDSEGTALYHRSFGDNSAANWNFLATRTKY